MSYDINLGIADIKPALIIYMQSYIAEIHRTFLLLGYSDIVNSSGLTLAVRGTRTSYSLETLEVCPIERMVPRHTNAWSPYLPLTTSHISLYFCILFVINVVQLETVSPVAQRTTHIARRTLSGVRLTQ